MDSSVKRVLGERGTRSKEHRSTTMLNGIFECTLSQADGIGKRENDWASIDSGHCPDDIVCESTLEMLVNIFFSQEVMRGKKYAYTNSREAKERCRSYIVNDVEQVSYWRSLVVIARKD
jgi:hypothetical protein